MKALIAIFMVPLLLFGMEKPPTVKVLIKKEVDGVVIEVKGAYQVFNPHTGGLLTSGSSATRYIMESSKDGLRWGAHYPGVHQMQIYPSTPDATLLVDGIEYRGLLDVYQIDGQLHVVNEVPIETYIKTQLTERFGGKGLERAVIESLAIIQRTDTYHIAIAGPERFFQVDGCDGRYLGYAATLIDLEIDHAVDATRNMVLIYRGRPFPCGWTDHCAGKTASYVAMFRKKGISPPGVDVALAKKARTDTHWKFAVEKKELARLAGLDHVVEVALFVEQNSKRAYALRVKDDRRNSDIEYAKLKTLLKGKLLSSEFSVHLERDQVVFEGYGKGDGTGLCLYTANFMAKTGKEAPAILGEFFPSTYLQKRDHLIPPQTMEIPHAKTADK